MANEELKEAVEEFYEGLRILKSRNKAYHTARFNQQEHLIEIFEADGSEMNRIIRVDEDNQVDAYRAATKKIGRLLAIREEKEGKHDECLWEKHGIPISEGSLNQ